MAGEQDGKAFLDFYQTDLKNKLSFLDGHFGRMWTRFNFFLTIESALLVLLWKPPDGTSLHDHVAVVAPIAVVFCLFWYFFGREDRYEVALQRLLIKATVKEITQRLGLSQYYYPGQTDDIRPEDRPPTSLTQGRIAALSVTRLAAIFPLAMIAIWVLMFIFTR